MQKGIIGKKIGMTQIFDENGKVVPVTVVEAGPCVVSQKKTVENDGYAAVQIGFGDLKAHKVKKPMAGHFAKANVAPKRTLQRVPVRRHRRLQRRRPGKGGRVRRRRQGRRHRHQQG